MMIFLVLLILVVLVFAGRDIVNYILGIDRPIAVKVVLEDGGIMPHRAHDDDACFDLYLPHDIVLKQGRQIVPLNFRVQIPKGWSAYVRSRSGFESKGMEVKTGERINAEVKTGVIDSGYRNVVGCIIDNREPSEYTLAKGTRIAQLALIPVPKVRFMPVDTLDDDSERGLGGFGSSGTK